MVLTGLSVLKIDHRKIVLSVNLIKSNKMRVLNKQYRGKDKTTDVLSFSYVKNGKLSNVELLRFIKKEKIMELGDVFIDPSVAGKQVQHHFFVQKSGAGQARGGSHSLEYEFAMLTTHGLLHLLGYDHERSKKDEKRMFDLQNKILSTTKFVK